MGALCEQDDDVVACIRFLEICNQSRASRSAEIFADVLWAAIQAWSKKNYRVMDELKRMFNTKRNTISLGFS